MIWRHLHPICDNCWERKVGPERYKIRDIHSFFTYDKHPPCCWCNKPSHGQFWKQPRLEVPCKGMFGFHADSPQVVDLSDLKERYKEDDEIKALVKLAESLRDEVALLEQGPIDLRKSASRPIRRSRYA